MRHLKVMAAYLCPPIWLFRDDTGIPVNFEARDLPLPEELVARIEAWDEAFQATLATRGFASEAELDDHIEQGIVLTREIGQEIGHWADVTIYEPSGDLQPDADAPDEWTMIRRRRAQRVAVAPTRKAS